MENDANLMTPGKAFVPVGNACGAGEQGSPGFQPGNSCSKGEGGVESGSLPLNSRTVGMTDNRPMSERRKISETIMKKFPVKEDWKNPRAYEIAEIAAHSFSSNGTNLIVAEEKSTGTGEGLITYYPDPDGVNITYLASVGDYRHVGEDLLKKVIDRNPGKDVNLYADPGAKTYYTHLGLEMTQDSGEGNGAVFRWPAEKAAAFAKGGREIVNRTYSFYGDET